MSNSVTRPHAVISGGSSGIGLAVAERLCAEGWNISLIARDQRRLAEARGRLARLRRDDAQRASILSADVADADQALSAAERAVQTLGAPKLLVTSAGTAVPGYFEQLSLETHHRVMNVNYFGTLYLVRALVPAMKSNRGGHIVLISSGAGLVGVFGYSAYSPSKFAVRGLAETLRGELKPLGIGVSLVYPPDVDTPQLRQENQTRPEETRMIAGNARVLGADVVAKRILREVSRNRFVIAPGWQMLLMSRLHSLISPLLNLLFDWQAGKVTRR